MTLWSPSPPTPLSSCPPHATAGAGPEPSRAGRPVAAGAGRSLRIRLGTARRPAVTPPAPLMPLDDALARLLAQALPFAGRGHHAYLRCRWPGAGARPGVGPAGAAARQQRHGRLCTALRGRAPTRHGAAGFAAHPGGPSRDAAAARHGSAHLYRRPGARGPMPWSCRKNAVPRAMAMCACRPRPARARTSAARGKTSPAAPWCCRPVRA